MNLGFEKYIDATCDFLSRSVHDFCKWNHEEVSEQAAAFRFSFRGKILPGAVWGGNSLHGRFLGNLFPRAIMSESCGNRNDTSEQTSTKNRAKRFSCQNFFIFAGNYGFIRNLIWELSNRSPDFCILSLHFCLFCWFFSNWILVCKYHWFSYPDTTRFYLRILECWDASRF